MITPVQDKQIRNDLTLAHHDYQKGLNGHAFFKVSNREMGEDLVQTTFIKTWEYLQKGGKIDMMKAFLYHILNNLIIDEYRKKKSTSLDALLGKGFEPSKDENEHRVNQLDGKSAVRLIKHLPEAYKKIMRMRYVKEFSLGKISLMTKQSKNTVAVQAHRGLEKLRLLYNRA